MRVRRYPVALALAMDDFAQLRCAAAEAFGLGVPIWVCCYTQLANSTLARSVFNLELTKYAQLTAYNPPTQALHEKWYPRTGR